ncbi:MAG: hypothetical protein P8N43_15245 [Alphaproteobacteria bacterium]|nr:hypothetical protein [Alphaproteobacteria bacterium]
MPKDKYFIYVAVSMWLAVYPLPNFADDGDEPWYILHSDGTTSRNLGNGSFYHIQSGVSGTRYGGTIYYFDGSSSGMYGNRVTHGINNFNKVSPYTYRWQNRWQNGMQQNFGNVPAVNPAPPQGHQRNVKKKRMMVPLPKKPREEIWQDKDGVWRPKPKNK